MISTLPEPLDELDFLQLIKQKIDSPCIRHSQLLYKKIQRVAILGGSGSFAISSAKAQKADIFRTADLKYYDFFHAENQLLLADVGHFESERLVKTYI